MHSYFVLFFVFCILYSNFVFCIQILYSFSLKDITKFAPNSERIQMPLKISRIRALATSQDLKVCKFASF